MIDDLMKDTTKKLWRRDSREESYLLLYTPAERTTEILSAYSYYIFLLLFT